MFTYKDENGKEENIDLLSLSKKQMRRTINGKRIAMVFQDPMTSLNPTMTIGAQIMEGMIWHYRTPKAEAKRRAIELLEMVGITEVGNLCHNAEVVGDVDNGHYRCGKTL